MSSTSPWWPASAALPAWTEMPPGAASVRRTTNSWVMDPLFVTLNVTAPDVTDDTAGWIAHSFWETAMALVFDARFAPPAVALAGDFAQAAATSRTAGMPNRTFAPIFFMTILLPPSPGRRVSG